jgi:hypothetical protein
LKIQLFVIDTNQSFNLIIQADDEKEESGVNSVVIDVRPSPPGEHLFTNAQLQ